MRDKSHFSLSAAHYEAARSGHLALRRQALVENALLRQRTEVRHVLEIGFGSGKLLAELALKYPHISFSGTEIEAKMVTHAQKQYALSNLGYMLADMTETRFTKKYDFVHSIDVLHHIHEPLPFLRAVRSSMGDGAHWFIIEPNVYHPYIHHQQDRMRRHGLDEDQFRPWVFGPLIRDSGFSLQERRYAFLFPNVRKPISRPLQWLEYRLERKRLLGGSVVYLLATK